MKSRYHDRYRINIILDIDEDFSSITLSIPTITPIVAVIDGCIIDCVCMIERLFSELDKKKNRKLAKRWLWRRIKDLDFGNTGYKVKDLYNRSKKPDYDYLETIDENDKYWKLKIKEKNDNIKR